jgi:hypothetical protein
MITRTVKVKRVISWNCCGSAKVTNIKIICTKFLGITVKIKVD